MIDYQYKGSKRNTGEVTKYKTTQLASETLGTTKYSYTYDNIGNITAIKKNDSAYSSYTYDELSQLTRENFNNNDGKTNNDFTRIWTYDALGNITSRKDYAYTTGAVGTETKTVKYYYPNEDIPYEDGTKKLTSSSWNNLLLAVDTDGNAKISDTEKISYDKIGNPVEYLDHDMSWFGRQLETITVGANTTDTTDNKTISFKYGADGLRRTKSVTTGNSTVTSEYVYANDLLIYEKRGNKELYFYYDGLGHLTAVRYYSSASSTSYKQYYVATNLAGDVLAFVDGDGDVVARYEYDAWGNCKVVNDTTSVKISNLNPIRYRGYYLDSETGLYYLQSRYYDPAIGRFISADTIDVLSVSPTELTDKNLFSYCDNNPITRADSGGAVWHIVAGAMIGGVTSFVSSVAIDVVLGNEIDWMAAGISAGFGALTGALTVACPTHAIAINSAFSTVESIVQDVVAGVDPQTTVINAVWSAGFGAVSGSWGNDLANTNKIDDAVNSIPKLFKGNHPNVKRSASKTVRSAGKLIGKSYLSTQTETFSMSLLLLGTQSYTNLIISELQK